MRNRALSVAACLILAGGILFSRMCRREYVPVKEDPHRSEFWRLAWIDIIISSLDSNSSAAMGAGGGDDLDGWILVRPDSSDATVTPEDYNDSASVLSPPDRPVPPPPTPKPTGKPPKTR